MVKIKNTMVSFELEDGKEVKLTLAYYRLYLLKERNKKTYEDYNKIMIKGPKEELEMITVLYAAYLCSLVDANTESIEGSMSYLEFLQRVPSDRKYVASIVKELTEPKKK